MNLGSTVTFSVTATGSTPLAYQWRKNGINIAGATKRSYVTPSVTAIDNGALFSVVVSNSVGSVSSASASVTVRVPPSITKQPLNRTVAVGGTALFSVSVTGTTPLAYQWRKNGINIAGATRRSYTTPAVTLKDNGARFSVVVSNGAGTVTSNDAILTVQ